MGMGWGWARWRPVIFLRRIILVIIMTMYCYHYKRKATISSRSKAMVIPRTVITCWK